MGCDYLVSLKYLRVRWVCYKCGREFDPESVIDKSFHEKCCDEHEGEMKIPAIMEADGIDTR